MTYYELVENIRDLGFSEDTEITEFETDVKIISGAINRAVNEINLMFAPIIAYIDINPYELSGDSEETADNLIEVIMPEEDELFLAFADNPVKRMLTSGVYSRFSDYEIENNNTLIIRGWYDGDVRIFYIQAHEPVDSSVITSTSEIAQTEIPLPLAAHHLVPLLASYYVWLEDEPTKAAQYYNLYEQRAAEYTAQTKKIRATIMGGGI